MKQLGHLRKSGCVVESVLVLLKPLGTLILKMHGGGKLLLAIGGFVVAAINFISNLFVKDKSEKKLVDSFTNRAKDIKIDDPASVTSAVGSLYEHGEAAVNGKDAVRGQ
jgi:hypothetical protein